jgi:hypothetical protein
MTPDSGEYQDIRDSILIVKGRFKAGSLKLYGQFIIIFKNNTAFDTYNTVVSTYSDIYNLEPHEDWLKYREFIANAKWKGTFNSNMTASMLDEFKKFSEQMNTITLLYTNVSEYDYTAMEVMLYDVIYRVIHDNDLILETAIQEITPSEYQEALSSTAAASKSAEKNDKPPVSDYEEYSLEKDAVILPVKPIVAPVKGKPIYELRVGDKLMIYIQPISERANYYIDYLDLRKDKEILPTTAQVIDIKAGSGKNNPTDILTLISPGVYGKITENEKQIKLKIYNPETDGDIEQKKGGKTSKKGVLDSQKEARKTGFSKGTVFMLVLFMVILLLFVVLIFLSW